MLGDFGVIIDWHISIGTIIEIASIILGGLWFVGSMKNRVDVMGTEVSSLKTEISKLADILTKLALQDQRITAQDKTIDELRHGIGFITPPPVFNR